MSLPTEEHRDVERRWFQRRISWLIGAVIVLAVGLVVFVSMRGGGIPDVGGGLFIEADPDTRIYVGDKLVGTTSVAFSWGELFGDEGHSAIAIELSNPDQALPAEMLSGPGAILLSQPSGQGIAGTWNVQVTQQSAYLIRRKDGELDPVFALILVWAPPNQDSSSYVLPIRLRKGSTPSVIYFDSAGVAITGAQPPRFMRFFGRSPNETKTKCSFKAMNPPSQLAEEIESKGLWEPVRAKKNHWIIAVAILCLLAVAISILTYVGLRWFRNKRVVTTVD
jgi:hypothetical protein